MITIVYAGTNDGWIESNDASYSDALNGNNRSAHDSADDLEVGQYYDGSFYRLRQSFLEFAYTAPSESLPVAGQFIMTGAGAAGTGTSRDLLLLENDWGGTLSGTDWLTPSQMGSSSFRGISWDGQSIGSGKMYAGIRQIDITDSSSTLRFVVASNRQWKQNAPSSDERNFFRSADYSGTSSDPALEVLSVQEHLLNRTLCAQVQLSDGTHLFVEQPDVDANLSPTLKVFHHDGTSATQVQGYDLSEQEEPYRGAQALALCRDEFDNAYIFAPLSTNANRIWCRPLDKGSGYTWTSLEGRTVSIPSDDHFSWVTDIAAAWHNIGGNRGTIVLQMMRGYGRSDVGSCMDPYVLLNPQALLTGGSHLVRKTGRGGDADLVAWPNSLGHRNMINPTGTLLDIHTAPNDPAHGFIISTERNQLNGENGAQSVAHYVLNEDGTDFVRARSTMTHSLGVRAVKDPDAKSRVIALSDSRFLLGTVSSSSSEGITVTHIENHANSSTFTKIDQIYLSEESISSMPGASSLSTSQAWDMVYNETDNSVWIYYFDTSDNNRLMRTQINLNTGLAVQNEVEVDASVGTSGSTNHAIRVHRKTTVSRDILVSVANETSGGTHSMIYLTDYVNSFPTQPELTPEANFDADTNEDLEWTFVDADPADTQSAYRVEIENATTGASAVDTGKTSSTDESHTVVGGTLSNGVDYRWRVRTWDSRDDPSPWSDWGTFTTSNTGLVNIIDPAADNDGTVLVADYTIEWTVTDAVQDEYQVVVTRVSDDVVLVDTGRVASTDKTYEIVGMLSDVEYLVEVTAWESDVASNTAERLITPDYNAPEVPSIDVSVNSSEGYINVAVTNPTPQGDRPNPESNDIYRREAGTNTKFLLVGSCEPNSSFKDYSAASGQAYEYKARAGVTS